MILIRRLGSELPTIYDIENPNVIWRIKTITNSLMKTFISIYF
ncbi:hypothetical protein WPG_0640 [Winogradskyella sp. PG-2]|nr:hypothetical protein WPG_0640 [Winogradskyella sp. PG-2]